MILLKKIRDYEEKYKDKELKISTEIKNFLNIQNKVTIKTNDFSTSAVIYSISMNSIKLIFAEDEILRVLSKNKNTANIYFYEFVSSNANPFESIHISISLANVSTYASSNKEYNLLSFDFSTPIPEVFAVKIGKLFDLKIGQNQRIDDRIIINKDSIRKLNLENEFALINVNSSNYKGIIKDLSYDGALIVCGFNDNIVKNSDINLVFHFSNLTNGTVVKGKIVNLNELNTPKGKVLVLGISYLEDNIPLDYSIAINDYFN